MKKFYNKVKILLLLTGLGVSALNAQDSNCYWQHQSIHTVQVCKQGWALGYALMELNSNDRLVVTFDELSVDARNLYYTLEHCDANWNPSGTMEMDFLQGINRVQVHDYSYAFNTMQPYVHYRVELPSDELRIVASGNYLIRFFDGPDLRNLLLVRPFSVYESRVSVQARVKQAFVGTGSLAMQEIDFVVKNPNFPISNARQEVSVTIQQNGRTDNRLSNLKPVFLRPSELVYTQSRTNLFEAGNEFRRLDVRSTRFWSAQVRELSFIAPFYHIGLNPDRWGDALSYQFIEDFNGRYVIETKEGTLPDTDADYVWVHFTLPADKPLVQGDIYVMGALSDWQFRPANRMVYNPGSGAYELSLFLKQGFYNYQYAFLPTGATEARVEPLERSFAQTGNDYLILVYYRGFTDRFDRLIGVSSVHSVRQQAGTQAPF